MKNALALASVVVATAACPSVSPGTGTPPSTSAAGGGGSAGGSGGGGSDADGGGTGGAPPDACAGYVAAGSASDSAASPRSDRDAEMLAFEAEDVVVARQATYELVRRDLAAIRAGGPAELADIHVAPSIGRFRGVVMAFPLEIQFDPASHAEVLAGSYSGWGCPNQHYGFTGREKMPGASSDWPVPIGFGDKLYNAARLRDAYVGIPGATAVLVNSVGGVDQTDICATVKGDARTYVFTGTVGDCNFICQAWHFWGFVVTGDAHVKALGRFDLEMFDAGSPPSWYEDARECRRHLLQCHDACDAP